MAAPSGAPKEEMFRLDPSADVNGTSLLTWFECPPVCLLELFGKPAEGDGHKVSGEYVFTNDKGDVFTLYDWKMTTLFWGEESGSPTPDEFWIGEDPEQLCVGGRPGSNPDAFLEWVVRRHKRFEAGIDDLMKRIEGCLQKEGKSLQDLMP